MGRVRETALVRNLRNRPVGIDEQPMAVGQTHVSPESGGLFTHVTGEGAIQLSQGRAQAFGQRFGAKRPIEVGFHQQHRPLDAPVPASQQVFVWTVRHMMSKSVFVDQKRHEALDCTGLTAMLSYQCDGQINCRSPPRAGDHPVIHYVDLVGNRYHLGKKLNHLMLVLEVHGTTQAIHQPCRRQNEAAGAQSDDRNLLIVRVTEVAVSFGRMVQCPRQQSSDHDDIVEARRFGEQLLWRDLYAAARLNGAQ